MPGKCKQYRRKSIWERRLFEPIFVFPVAVWEPVALLSIEQSDGLSLAARRAAPLQPGPQAAQPPEAWVFGHKPAPPRSGGFMLVFPRTVPQICFSIPQISLVPFAGRHMTGSAAATASDCFQACPAWHLQKESEPRRSWGTRILLFQQFQERGSSAVSVIGRPDG